MGENLNKKALNQFPSDFDRMMNDLMYKSFGEVLRLFEYISFGILIALVSYGKPFISIHKISSGLCFIAALLSVLTIFVYYLQTYKISDETLTTDRGNDQKYIDKLKRFKKHQKWLFILPSLSVLFFINVSLIYFFEFNIICKIFQPSSQCPCEKKTEAP